MLFLRIPAAITMAMASDNSRILSRSEANRACAAKQVGLRVGTGDVGLLVDFEAEARPPAAAPVRGRPGRRQPTRRAPPRSPTARTEMPLRRLRQHANPRRCRSASAGAGLVPKSRPMTSTFTLVSASDLSVRSLSANTIAAAPSSAQTDSVCCTSSIDSG